MAKRIFIGFLFFVCIYISVLAGDDINNDFYGRVEGTDDVPYQVSLYLNYNDQFLCGGVIVSSNKVLSVAHCLYYSWGGELPPLILSVKAGSNSLTTGNPQNYDVNDIIFHPGFNNSVMDFNLAVIEVSTNFPVGNSAIGQIALNTDPFVKPNSCVVSGWNLETNDLRVIDVEIIDCGQVHSKKICATNKYKNDTLCKYSLASSLVCDEKLSGLMSFKPDCNTTNQMSIFENIKYAHNFLGLESNSTSSVSSVKPTIQIFKNTIFNITLMISLVVIKLFL